MDTSSGQGEQGRRVIFAEKKQVCWYPAMNVGETESQIILEVELPGMSSDQIELTVTGDTLQIRGERHRSPERGYRNYYVMEREFGPFHRCIQLPSFVDPSRVRAEFSHGILAVVLPKVAGGDSRVIAVTEG